MTRRVFYGWPMLAGLSVAETLSWGVLYYSFSVLIHPIELETGWTRAQVTGAFSLALLASGLAAVPVGHWLDTRGARGLMTSGSLVGALLLAALSRVESLPGFYAIWLGLGLVMAAVLYEPAFAVVATWFVRHRDRALTILTLCGGLASPLLLPLATWLVNLQGWRHATLSLALLLAATTVPLHAFLLRKNPAALGLRPDGDDEATEVAPTLATHAGIGSAVAEPRFWMLTAALTLASLVAVATSVHVIPYLVDAGLGPEVAALVLGLAGFMQLAGRLVFAPLRVRFGWQWITAGVFLAQGAGLAVLAYSTSRLGLAAFACLFGMANGIATLVRASTLAHLYGAERYGRVGGVVSLFSTFGRAGGPFLAALLYERSGSYGHAFGALVGLLLVATGLVLIPACLPWCVSSRAVRLSA